MSAKDVRHVRQIKTSLHIPVRIVLKSNLLGRTLPIPNFPTRSINHLVVIILLSHTFRDHGTSLEVDSLPGTYLPVNVCEAKGIVTFVFKKTNGTLRSGRKGRK